MGQVRDEIKKRVADAAGVAVEQVRLEHPELEVHGDYSTNIALVAKGGRGLAEKIAESIKPDELIAKVEVAGPGFVNIWLQKGYLVSELERVITQGRKYGSGLALVGKKVMVEFTDPNPFKEFHIGHLYSNIVGEALSRLLENQGAEVWRVCYQGDVGIHVAKAVWGMEQLKTEMPKEDENLAAKAKFMGKAYSVGATAYEEDPTAKREIDSLNKRIYENDAETRELYEVGKRWSLKYFDTVYARLGTKFKKLYFESDAGKAGLDYVRQNLKRGIFEESQGAVVFRGENYGLHTRVFVNSAGLPTYEAKELGLAPTKYKDFPYDLSIIVTGNEIDEYFKVLLKALELISPELATKTKHISHGMVRLPEGKMSSRTGKIITGEWLLDEAIVRTREISPQTPEPEKIGQAAVKYALLKNGIGKDVEFDFGESVSFEGNSGPYLQYTYARIRSVLVKGGGKRGAGEPSNINDEEIDILRYIYRFPEVVEEAGERMAPNLVASFLYVLAQRFNTFYNRHSILSADNERIKSWRLEVALAVDQVLENGLWLLGIEAPERM